MAGQITAARRTMSLPMSAACAMCLMALTAAQPAATDKTAPPAKPKVAAKAAAPAKAAPASTLTGCLQTDGARYVLTDLTDRPAPKTRTWKTAFITKRSKRVEIEIVGASASVKLKDQVGHKVAIVGTEDGEAHMMTARSIKLVSRTCL